MKFLRHSIPRPHQIRTTTVVQIKAPHGISEEHYTGSVRSTTHDDNARSWRDRRPTHSRTGVAGQRRSGRGLCRRPLPHELFAGARFGRLAPALTADDPDEPSIYLMAAAPPLSHEPLHFLAAWVRQDHHRSPSPHGPRPEAGRSSWQDGGPITVAGDMGRENPTPTRAPNK